MSDAFFTLPLALVSGAVVASGLRGQCLSLPLTAIVVKGKVATL